MKALAVGFAAAMLAGSPAAAQQGGEGAERFVRQVFAAYGPDGDGALGDTELDLYWRPETAALIRRDRDLATDEPPYLDADPLCQCQDWEDLAVRRVHISQIPGVVGLIRRADILLVNGGERVHVVLKLRGGPNRWRIEDVLGDSGGPTLVEALTASIQRVEAGGRPLYRE